MKKKKKPNLALLEQGINGIAEMYAELTAKLTRLEGSVRACEAQCAHLIEAQRALEKRMSGLHEAYRAVSAEQIMQEYCYGKRGDQDA
jgi:DNA-binding transcriptional regulator YbjK